MNSPPRTRRRQLAASVRRRFDAVLFDWDGTAVPDRQADASKVGVLIDDCLRAGLHLAIISGTNLTVIESQLHCRPDPDWPGRLYMLLNRGSEVFTFDRTGPHLLWRRQATDIEERALDDAASLCAERLAQVGLPTKVVANRLNRRKIDLIPTPQWANPPKALISQLVIATGERLAAAGLDGLPAAVKFALQAAADCGLPEAKVTSDAKYVEIGLTDKADSARWIARELWGLGVGPGQMLVAGDEFGSLGGVPGSDDLLRAFYSADAATTVSVGPEPSGVPNGVFHLGGGPEMFRRLLADQLHRRSEPPQAGGAAGWQISLEGLDPVRVAELEFGDGRLVTAGTTLAHQQFERVAVRSPGVFDSDGSACKLLELPAWDRLNVQYNELLAVSRTLDLHSGLLHETLSDEHERLDSVRFCALAHPGLAVLRVCGHGEHLHLSSPALEGNAETPVHRSADGLLHATVGGATGGAAVIATQSTHRISGHTHLNRLAAYATDPRRIPPLARPSELLKVGLTHGTDALLTEQREAWAERWKDCDVRIDGDEQAQLAVRFAMFHLMSLSAGAGETALGARSATGHAYNGHVFWDIETFALPFFAATHPETALAMLRYRARRLEAAQNIARLQGRRGARFPWESAASGYDVTPGSMLNQVGQRIVVTTGLQEEHITADVAWGAAHYLDWSGDEEFALGDGMKLLVETARYWASRVEYGSDGAAHITGVTGPDEYHENVADSAYTNIMARWNLRRAATHVAHYGADVTSTEIAQWQAVADALVDGYDAERGLYEQFAGYFSLEELLPIQFGAPPVPLPILIGAERCHSSQALKQADVVMAHLLAGEEMAPGSFEADVDFYLPRTSHESSLSAGAYATALAQLGRAGDALQWLRYNTGMDLPARGPELHTAAMGGTWRVLVHGMLGLQPEGDVMRIRPQLPSTWRSLEARVRFRGARLRIRATPAGVHVQTDRATRVALSTGPAIDLAVGETLLPSHQPLDV